MVRFIIVRHGLSNANKEQRFSGQYDFPLDEIGVQQADAVSKYIYETFKVDRIYSSDLSRAYNTVKPLSELLGMEIIKRSDLREINVGVWQNVLFKEVQEKYPETFKKYISNPGVWTFEGGECYADVQKRALHALEEIAAENEGKTVVIGTHGGLIRALRAAWEGIPLSEFKKVPNISNCSVTVVEYSNGSVKLLSIGNTEHLTGNNAIV